MVLRRVGAKGLITSYIEALQLLAKVELFILVLQLFSSAPVQRIILASHILPQVQLIILALHSDSSTTTSNISIIPC